MAISNEELNSWYGHGLHPPKVIRLIEEIRELREDNADLRILIERLDKPVIHTYRSEDVEEILKLREENAELQRENLALRARIAATNDVMEEYIPPSAAPTMRNLDEIDTWSFDHGVDCTKRMIERALWGSGEDTTSWNV